VVFCPQTKAKLLDTTKIRSYRLNMHRPKFVFKTKWIPADRPIFGMHFSYRVLDFVTKVYLSIGLFRYVFGHEFFTYSRAPGSLIQYPRFTAAPKELKIKEIRVHKFQNVCQARTGRNMGKSSSPNAPQYLTQLPLPLYSRFPIELASILLLAFSLFALVATLSQCLCSESFYLSIKLYHIYVCHTQITLYIATGIVRCLT
jgi:hypothetical protein